MFEGCSEARAVVAEADWGCEGGGRRGQEESRQRCLAPFSGS